MIAQECPTCGAKPGFTCRCERWVVKEHVARKALEFGDWTRIYDEKYRDKTLKFQCKKYAA